MATGPHRIGWREYVDFVDWRLRRFKTKIDTGARTSALGVLSYELREEATGDKTAVLRLALNRRHPERVKVIVTPVLKMIVVCNSGGTREQRPLVETTLRLGPVTKRVRLTITNRSGMRFGLILGRKALEGDFLVDVAGQYLLETPHPNPPPQGGKGEIRGREKEVE
jgi:hypothetical protein